MIAVSSFRPLGESAEYDHHQLTARASWEVLFDGIVYLNEPDRRMGEETCGGVRFLRFVDAVPTIQALAQMCASQQTDWVCIINADIFVSERLKAVEAKLNAKWADCAMSRRYEFAPMQPLANARVVDLGLDFFAARPEVWLRVAETIPPEFRIGHILWDTWMLAFFNHHYPDSFYDITPAKVIFHPKHGGRKNQGLTLDIDPIDPMADRRNLRFPKKKIRL